MLPHGYALAVVAQSPSATFQHLAASFIFALGVTLISSMGIVDGLVFRRVRVRYGVMVLATFRGVLAQLIGIVCIFTAIFGLYLVVLYVTMLGSYCKSNVGCFIATPIRGMVAGWWAIFLNLGILFCFLDWLKRRLEEVGVPPARRRRKSAAAPNDRLSYSIPSVYHFVNLRLSQAKVPLMNRPEIERIMEFVEQHAPFVVLSGAAQVMDGKRLDPAKLASVFATDKQFRDKGQRVRIALEAVTEVYVDTRQPREHERGVLHKLRSLFTNVTHPHNE